ncbi:ABC-type enterochelin transport system substrate-binding protein [Pedobacter africanus]|jgi:ABC-type enterochelin transport system substrate-binding protein|uniref:ABC-type enterochelin transport system substrate-binding protein n=1 Tax=Pedobacter africanus TaxID=151894 RepID=A0ACC6L5N8_9SPHI|nr:hypothetical protein [Pedobacter africanus]MDR6786633.1 ABC-type enterochelin transport system substrate-binding protein [Pedobacter africanus]
MNTRSILILITVFLFTACNSQNEKETTKTSLTTTGTAKDSSHTQTDKEISNVETNLPGSLVERNLPITDSTNFDNFEKFGMRDKGFLKRIKFDPRRKDATNFRLNYKIPFSENFTSVVITYKGGENELFTILLTVDKNDKIIDKLEIAYDEIAESAFGKTSKIEKDKIVVTSSNWMNAEKPIFKDETYVLDKTGKFEKMKN